MKTLIKKENCEELIIIFKIVNFILNINVVLMSVMFEDINKKN